MKRILVAIGLMCTLCVTPAFAMENPFTDIDSDSNLAHPVMWALDKGVTAGTSDTTFSPDMVCTRGQVVTFLYRASGSPEVMTTENKFTDVAADSPFYTAILWAVENGITTGTSETTFSPNLDCTSEQIITFIYRANHSPEIDASYSSMHTCSDWAKSAVNWADYNGMINLLKFKSLHPSPRIDVVTYLWINDGSPMIEIDKPVIAQDPTDAEEVLELVNIERATFGLNALTLDDKVMAAAVVRSAEVEVVFSHTRPDGRTCFTAMDEAGVVSRREGENIASGFRTPESVVTAWMNSPGHRANILDSGFTMMGIGRTGHAWAQMFAQ